MALHDIFNQSLPILASSMESVYITLDYSSFRKVAEMKCNSPLAVGGILRGARTILDKGN
jgi:hypothetical protein